MLARTCWLTRLATLAFGLAFLTLAPALASAESAPISLDSGPPRDAGPPTTFDGGTTPPFDAGTSSGESGGCSVAPGQSTRGPALALFGLGAVALAGALRRRR